MLKRAVACIKQQACNHESQNRHRPTSTHVASNSNGSAATVLGRRPQLSHRFAVCVRSAASPARPPRGRACCLLKRGLGLFPGFGVPSRVRERLRVTNTNQRLSPPIPARDIHRNFIPKPSCGSGAVGWGFSSIRVEPSGRITSKVVKSPNSESGATRVWPALKDTIADQFTAGKDMDEAAMEGVAGGGAGTGSPAVPCAPQIWTSFVIIPMRRRRGPRPGGSTCRSVLVDHDVRHHTRAPPSPRPCTTHRPPATIARPAAP